MTLRQQTILIWIHISLTAPDVDWYDRTFHHPPLTWILNCLYTRPELRMNRLYGHCSRQGWMNYQHPLQKKTKGQKPAFIFSAQFLFLFFFPASVFLAFFHFSLRVMKMGFCPCGAQQWWHLFICQFHSHFSLVTCFTLGIQGNGIHLYSYVWMWSEFILMDQIKP